jgi:hypothetical protein
MLAELEEKSTKITEDDVKSGFGRVWKESFINTLHPDDILGTD